MGAQGNTIWTAGRQKSRAGGSVVGESPHTASRCFHLGKNKEVFNVEVFALLKTLMISLQRKVIGQHCTIFSDSDAGSGESGQANRV